MAFAWVAVIKRPGSYSRHSPWSPIPWCLHNGCPTLIIKVITCNNKHLFTGTVGNRVFCGNETTVVTRRELCFPEVPVNKCFVIY